ncbi:MAG: hypothetical protein PHN39_03790 [Candidatus Pacebacteria bacterium]|nr:hypothetical protein [Candidatus Paceibacterota bacterium]
MSANLRHKRYYFFNQPLTEEEYKRKVRELNMGNRAVLESLKAEFSKIKSEAIYKENHNIRAIDCFGEYLTDSKNCYSCMFAVNSENLAYSAGSFKIRDSYDAFGGLDSSLAYESHAGIACSGLKFSCHIKFSRDLEYCVLCNNCHNCFACIGLRNKSFCILNRQYGENEYWSKVDEIKIEMLRGKEYGEFFPPNLMPVPYNISIATSYKGYDDIETAKRYGYTVQDIIETVQGAGEEEVIDAEQVLSDIKDIKDDVLSKIIFDKESQKKFRYIKEELEFHRRYNLALPLEHPSVRLAQKRKMFGSLVLKLYKRDCTNCQKGIESIYPPGEPKNVYCEECYLKEVV